MLRVVLDPGVLIAALLSRSGAPAQLLVAWRAGLFDLVISPKLLAELGRVLARPKFRQYLSVEESERYVELFRRAGNFVEDPVVEQGLTADPGDDYLVALGRASRARYLVSGDRHLTELQQPDPPVLLPRALLKLLEKEAE